LTNPTT